MIKEINMRGAHNKWLALMNHIRHSAPVVYQCIFPDAQKAQDAVRCMLVAVERNPTWFKVLILRRGCNVFVIKEDQIQKAVIVDE